MRVNSEMAKVPSDDQVPPALPAGATDDSGGNSDRGQNASATGSAGQTFDAGEGRIFPCDGCGADLEFRIGDQVLACQFCGHVKQI